MKAIVFDGFNKVKIEDKTDPVLLKVDDAIIKVTLTSICGSDLHLVHGMEPSLSKGFILGHETIGIVEEKGINVTRVNIGDRVIVPFPISCGHCAYCNEGMWSMCDNSNGYGGVGAIYGAGKLYGNYQGGQAEYLKVPLMEHVAIPYLNNGDEDNIVVTPEPVPVGWIHEKRMQQTLLKKNSGSTSIKKRNPNTGQVINEDKNARNSDVETYSMIAIGAINGLKEMQGPRADDTLMKDQMYSAINRNGYVKLEDLDSLPENKVALNTLDAYFMMMGFTTNLVTPLDMISVEQLKGGK